MFQELVNSNIITPRESNVYYYCNYCKCEMKKHSIYKHIKTMKHTRNQTEIENSKNPIQCDICYTDKKKFFTCQVCKNQHCRDCRKQIQNKKCPFCRNVSLDQTEQKELIENSISIFKKHTYEIKLHAQRAAYLREYGLSLLKDSTTESEGKVYISDSIELYLEIQYRLRDLFTFLEDIHIALSSYKKLSRSYLRETKSYISSKISQTENIFSMVQNILLTLMKYI